MRRLPATHPGTFLLDIDEHARAMIKFGTNRLPDIRDFR